jgi:signal transduction histidine kinase
MNNLSSLSKEQLEQNLRELHRHENGRVVADETQVALQSLQVHEIELEMQNRALREMQSELEHSVQRYADLYDNLPLAYVTVTAQGQVRGANRAACEWLKRDKRGLIGAFLGSFMDAYDAGRFSVHLESCVRTGAPSTIELVMRPAAGQKVNVQLCSRLASHRPDEESPVHIAITDISRLKQAQKVLEEINREQEAFNYSISHDLRAPLVTITNYAAIVLGEHGQTLDPTAKGMIERIRCAAQRMEDTLKDLLEYSTLAREEIVLQPINMESIVTDLLTQHRGLIEEKQAEIAVERPLPTVRAARAILGQVLTNVLTNALKYTEPGQPPRVRIFAEMNDQHAVVKVADNGIGIDPKHHERIFKVFERLHGYSRYPGSGVGLAIARRAMERMHGRIWVESELGKGSCFCLQLPAV